MKKYFNIVLSLHDLNPQKTSTASVGNDLSPTMKTFYEKELLEEAKPALVHNQFGQERDIPKGNGKSIEFRKLDTLPKATEPLTEGVAPDGTTLNMTSSTATVNQYGAFVTITDMLDLTNFDNLLADTTKLIADQAGRTLDTITREIINAGTNVWHAGGAGARHLLVGGSATATDNKYLTVDDIKRAVRQLKVVNARPINGYYVAIIHPDCTYDLQKDPEWKYPHQYRDTMNLYNGEIGMIAGVRFVETTEAKIFHADNLLGTTASLTVAADVSANATSFTYTGAATNTVAGRILLFRGKLYKASTDTASGTTHTVAIDTTASGYQHALPAIDVSDDADITVYPGEAGAAGRDVYSTLVTAEGAYGVTKVEGGGLEYIFKSKEQGGGPLNQYATTGWKATATAKLLLPQYIVRIESASTFQAGAN